MYFNNSFFLWNRISCMRYSNIVIIELKLVSKNNNDKIIWNRMVTWATEFDVSHIPNDVLFHAVRLQFLRIVNVITIHIYLKTFVTIALSRNVPLRHSMTVRIVSHTCASHNSLYPLHFIVILRDVILISWNTILYQRGKLMLWESKLVRRCDLRDFPDGLVVKTALPL